ncbi:uncharacterized protein LOC123677860 [Harmonia axyridis]|uniref:uncharacterized protein LOC123677860 n=1 Tax=Harmonia axyridis TaxID=115357 RepID=UPI001E2776D1|nr:uncharacterized protein LOC123677860 [Harmonia axyridis]
MDRRKRNKSRLRLSARRKKNKNLAKYNQSRLAGLPYLNKSILTGLDAIATNTGGLVNETTNNADVTYSSSSNDLSSEATSSENAATPHTQEPRELSLDGSRVVYIQQFLDSLKELSNHSNNSECNLSKMRLVEEIKTGFQSKLVFVCDICMYSKIISTYPEHPDVPDIKTPSVSNVMNCGGDYTQQKKIVEDGPTQLKRVLKKTAVPSLQLGRISRSEELAINSSEKKLDDLSDGSETSDSSSIDNGNILIRGDNADLSIVKEEPCSPNVEESEQQEEPHFIITSAITVKEENDHSDKPNGILESENDYFSRNHLEYSYESSPDHLRSKRLKHDDTLIAPEDIKVETCSTSFTFNFDCNLSIEVKYERLLDEFLKLKRDYDLLKFKFEKQSEAISKCEHILSHDSVNTKGIFISSCLVRKSLRILSHKLKE